MAHSPQSQKSRILKSLSAGMIVEIFNKIFPVIILAVAQAKLGKDGFGRAGSLINLAEILIPIVLFGYALRGPIQVAKVAACPKQLAELCTHIALLRLANAFLSLIILFCICWFYPKWREQVPSLLFIAPFLIVAALDTLYVQSGSQRMFQISIWQGLYRLVGMGVVWWLIDSPADALRYTGVMLGIGAAISLQSALWTFRRVGFAKPKWGGLKAVFKDALPYAAPVFLFPLYERFDVGVAQLTVSAYDFGVYWGTWKLAMSLVPFFTVISQTFFSEALVETETERFQSHAALSLIVCLALTIPIAFALPVVGPQLTAKLYGAAFLTNKGLLPVFGFDIVLEVFLLILGVQVMLIKGRAALFSLLLGVTIAIGAGLSFCFGHLWGQAGIAAGGLIARFFLVVVLIRASRRDAGSLPWKTIFHITAASSVMLIALYSFPKEWHFLILIGLGGSVYALILGLLERHQLKSIIRNIKAQRGF